MKANPDVDFYILKPEITGKQQSKKRKKQLSENQKNTECRNINKMVGQFLRLACKGEIRTLVSPSVTPLLYTCVVFFHCTRIE